MKLTRAQVFSYVKARGANGASMESLKLLHQGKKACRKCKEVLSLESFWKDSKTFDGHQSTCKKCSRKYDADAFVKDFFDWAKKSPTPLECHRCGVRHPLTAAHWPSKRDGALVTGTIPTCTKCVR